VEASDPTLKFSSGDLFARILLLNTFDDLRDLLVVHRLGLYGGRFGKLHCRHGCHGLSSMSPIIARQPPLAREPIMNIRSQRSGAEGLE